MTEPPQKNLVVPSELAISQKMLEVSLPPNVSLPDTHSHTRDTSNICQVRFLGSHMVESDARLDELLDNSSLRAHPIQCSPKDWLDVENCIICFIPRVNQIPTKTYFDCFIART